MRNITKRFGAKVLANDKVWLDIYRGEILSLLGENGSGKTTLMNMLSGIYFPDEGTIEIDGREVVIRSPKDAFSLGIGMVHQHFKLVDVLTAAENIVLGLDEKFDMKAAAEKIHAICDRYGFDVNPDQKIYDMSVSQKQTVEIVKVLYRNANILILDEPTAVLTPQETDKLFAVMRNMRADGKAIVIITHKLHEVEEISDRVAILRKGQFVGDMLTKDTNAEEMTNMMVGHAVTLNIERPEPVNSRPRLEVNGLTVRSQDGILKLDDVSFTLNSGEILGIAGISGCGQKELLEAIAGLQKAEDVNESDADFTVAGSNIRFGLAAIKGVGRGAVAELTAERTAGGVFRDFEDFLRRMSGKELNRRAIENMILAGCFDSMGFSRRALTEAVGPALDGIARERKDNIEGQMDLFGMLSENGENAHLRIQIPKLEEYPKQERMAKEKDVTGLYLSGHPMDEYREAIRGTGVIPIGSLIADFASETGPEIFSDGQQVLLAGVIESAKTKTTKNNNLMCTIRLEDDTGSIEVIAFQRVLDQSNAYLEENTAVAVSGRISLRDEKDPQLMADSIQPLSGLMAREGKSVSAQETASVVPEKEKTLWVKISSQEDPLFEHIRLLLTMFPGNDRIILYCEKEKKKIGARCLRHETLLAELRELCGDSNVVVR